MDKIYCKDCMFLKVVDYQKLDASTCNSSDNKREVVVDTWYESHTAIEFIKTPVERNAQNNCNLYRGKNENTKDNKSVIRR